MISNIQAATLQQITHQQAWRYRILPFYFSSSEVHLYIDKNRLPSELGDELEMIFGKTISFEGIERAELEKALVQAYGPEKTEKREQPIVRTEGKIDGNFLENLIREAKDMKSSDIHLEPYEETCRIRFRIDGKLVEKYQITKLSYPSLINKIKVKSNLDISEKRLPQDGRIFFQEDDKQFDIRVSTLPTLHGEKVVMRLLTSDDNLLNLQTLGFSDQQIITYREGIRRPNGMVLISGPTGSGKTSTLYATLKELNKSERNIVTIEDPIEYTLEGINQVQLKESIGLDFASAMKTFLRQDPDIIMLGEVRDQATASMAIRASLTGHLVFSTLHTNSAWGIVARLIDMGIPGYLLADTLNMAVAQRLIRLLCQNCKEEAKFTNDLLPSHYKISPAISHHYQAKGCPDCHFTGYRGRQAIYEIIPIDEVLSEKVRKEELNIKKVLSEKEIKSLSVQALNLFRNGLSSAEEIYPILSGGA